MFKKLRTVIYHTDDLAATKSWYSQLLGKAPYFDESFYVGFDVNGSELGLDPDWSGIEKGNQSIAFWDVDAIESCVETLQLQGASIKNSVKEVGEGIKVAVVNDPFGNTIGLIEGA
ncbi:MAG: VOC family protein [Ferruginibacter sp.]